MSDRWTPEDWDIWKSGQWASWWPTKLEWYGQDDQPENAVPPDPANPPLTPKPPDPTPSQETQGGDQSGGPGGCDHKRCLPSRERVHIPGSQKKVNKNGLKNAGMEAIC